MPTNKVFVNPTDFNPLNLFMIVLVDGEQGLVDWAIKDDTGSNYNHAMTQRNLQTFDSQDLLFESVPISKFLSNSNMLKFWYINDLTPDEWIILTATIRIDLSLPWWKRLYNFLGIFGQFVRLRWISCPGTYFCSERVAKYLRLLPRIAAILPEKVSPGFEDSLFTAHPELFTCLGYWWQD